MNKITFSKQDKIEIHEQLKSSYDHLVAPPRDFMNSITHVLNNQPKNFTTLSIQEIEDFIIKQFGEKEPLIENLSEDCRKRLENAIRRKYYGTNIIDLKVGGNGLIIPTFIEIMSEFIFWIKDSNLIDLKTATDTEFYSKYFWCFEAYGHVIYNQNLKKKVS